MHQYRCLNAQQELAANQSKLEKQESALLDAHKQSLEEATLVGTNSHQDRSAIEKLPMPDEPTVWFDLLPYLQSQPQIESLPVALSELMDELENGIENTQSALELDDRREILKSSKILVELANKVNSKALSYQMQSIENDCARGLVDNVSIRWPATKQGLEKTLRVVYSHLHS